MTKTVGSVCSGIEAASVAWEPLGFKFKWFSEIAPFPSKLLAEKYPNVPNLGDMTYIEQAIRSGNVETTDIRQNKCIWIFYFFTCWFGECSLC